MGISADPRFFVGFLLAATRCGAFLTVAPPFQGAVPAKIRAGLSVALGLALAPHMATLTDLPVSNTAALLAAIVFQVGIGLALGTLVFVLFQAAQAAGSAIDTFAGLTAASLYDPMSRSNSSPMGRMYQMLGTLILFTTGGHLMIVGGLVRSFDAAPLTGFHADRLAELLTVALGQFLLSALQIAAPLLGALFVTELLLGLASKAAPQLNILVVGFGVKGLVLITLSAAAFPLLVIVVPKITDQALDAMGALLR